MYLIDEKIYWLSFDSGNPEMIKYYKNGITAFEDKETSEIGVFIKTYIDDVSTYQAENAKIEIYDCDEIKCYRTKGSVKISNNDVLYCDTSGCSNSINECNRSGDAFYNNSKFQYCDHNNENFEIKTNDLNYSFIRYSDNQYYVYKSNMDGTIFAISKTGN